jgi:hypothetical protein
MTIPTPPLDDLADVQTSWGVMPRWKAKALALGEIQAVLREAIADDAVRADDAATPLADKPSRSKGMRDEDKAPPLAADADRIDPGVLAMIHAAIDALEQRLEALEEGQRRERAIDAAMAATPLKNGLACP